MTVGSKWGYTYTADWRVDADEHEVKDHSVGDAPPPARRRRRELLGAHLGLYQIHSATLESGVLDDRRGAARSSRDCARRRRAIGLTVTGPRQAETIERALEVGGCSTPCRRRGTCSSARPAPALPAAHAAGLGRDRQGGPGQRPADRARRHRRPAGRRRRERGDDPDALALAFVLAQPWVDVVLSGAATAVQPSAATCRPSTSSPISPPSKAWPRTPSATGRSARRSPGAERARGVPVGQRPERLLEPVQRSCVGLGGLQDDVVDGRPALPTVPLRRHSW